MEFRWKHPHSGHYFGIGRTGKAFDIEKPV